MAYAVLLPGPPPEAAGADDAEEAAWVDPLGARDLAFDHARILQRALAANTSGRPAYIEFICCQYPVYGQWVGRSAE